MPSHRSHSIKPSVFALIFSVALVAGVCRAAETAGLERAIRELPSQFVADVPPAQRALLSSRVDKAHGYLHWYSDGREVDASSMLYMRQFARADGSMVVLTHMPKPFADGSTPQANQTFVFERRADKWTDITAEVFPKGIDLTLHFRPRKTSDIIDVMSYAQVKRQDGRGETWQFGSPVAELHWDGRVFQKREPAKDGQVPR